MAGSYTCARSRKIDLSETSRMDLGILIALSAIAILILATLLYVFHPNSQVAFSPEPGQPPSGSGRTPTRIVPPQIWEADIRLPIEPRTGKTRGVFQNPQKPPVENPNPLYTLQGHYFLITNLRSRYSPPPASTNLGI